MAVILSALGVALGGVVLFIHHRLAASQGAYISFCDISAKLSCDVVLGSAYAKVLGIPVAAWGAAAYFVAGAMSLALRGTRGDALLRVALTLVAFTGGMLGISLYFFVISAAVIGVGCPMCLSLDAVNVALFAVAVAIVRALRPTAPPGWPAPGVFVLCAVLTAGAVGALVALQAPRESAGGALTVDQVRAEDPRFYAFYISQPVTDVGAGEVRHAEGSAKPVVTIVEYSDFECPYCGRAFGDLQRAQIANEPDIRLVFRNFPLNSDCNPQIRSQPHAHACQAAVAAECAGAQGKFPEFQAILFQHQDALDTPSLVGYAARLGLDQTEFERCLTSPAAAAAVAEDVAAGAAAGVTSTPTFFINGRRIAGGFQRSEHYRYAIAIERELSSRPSASPTAAP